MPIYECDYLYDIIQSRPLTSASLRFIKASQCSNRVAPDNTPIVCCYKSISNYPKPNSAEKKQDFNYYGGSFRQFDYSPNLSRRKFEIQNDSPSTKSISNLLNDECGKESIGNRIYSGDDTEIHDFPWMSVLEYKKR